MAGWTDVSGNDFDWQAVSFVNEFITALNERASVAGLSAFDTTKSAGHDIQDRDFWYDMQKWVEDNCGSFSQSKENPGGGWTTMDYDGKGAIAAWTWDNLKTYIKGAIQGGFRRYTTHPDDGGSVAYGHMAVGDIIGPWIFQDLQKAINALEWTAYTASAYDNAAVFGGNIYRWGDSVNDAGSSFATQAAALAAAQTEYDNASWGSSKSSLAVNPPGAHSGFTTFIPAGPFYDIAIQRRRHYLQSTSLPSTPAAAGKFWLWTEDPVKSDPPVAGLWDDHGDSDVAGTERIYKRWAAGDATKATSTTTLVSAAALANNDTAPDQAPYEAAGSWQHTGWWMTSPKLVLDWGVSGGFTYYE